MGRFGQMMIYFGKKWGRLGSGCFGNGGVLTCIHHLPLFSVHEVTLNIFIITSLNLVFEQVHFYFQII
jgi:hypothetical protein